jgi:hypothetical protein
VAISKIASLVDDRLETDVRSASSGLHAIHCHKALRGLSVGTVPFPVRYGANFSTAAVTVSSLVGVRTVRGQPAFMCAVGVALPVARRRCSS